MPRNPATDKALGVIMRRVRMERGFSQEVVAFRSGVTTATIGRLESGRSDPSWSTIRTVAEALELPLHDLITAIEAAEA
jgi:transcriptional regulator with XRE-family HTH domain